MSSTFNAALVGCTGLVGSQILKNLIAPPVAAHVQAIARRELPESGPNVVAHTSADTAKWPDIIQKLTPTPSAFFSALGTTRGQAGSATAQRAVDYDLNLELARAAHTAGVPIYVLISGNGASASSPFGYIRMKGELERDVKALGFEHTVIVQPGLLLGSRQDSRPSETVFRYLATGMRSVLGHVAIDFWAQDAQVVARAATAAARECVGGRREKGVWELAQADIVRLGRTEWKE